MNTDEGGVNFRESTMDGEWFGTQVLFQDLDLCSGCVWGLGTTVPNGGFENISTY